ncbi:MAG: NADH-quinone oxidoreductase subunit K [Bacteroidota bacterium]
MQLLLALLTGILFAAGVYLVLRRNLLRMIFGIVLLSNAVNLLVLSMGRVVRVGPPLVPLGAEAPVEAYANPVPQALVLTAIVIGFGLVSFALVLAYRSFATLGTVESDALGPEDLPEDPLAPAGVTAAGAPLAAPPEAIS